MLQIPTRRRIKPLFSKTYAEILQSIKILVRPPKIRNFDDYSEFLHDSATRTAGGLVLSYAQKRAGKLHFRLAKERDYADELIRAQIGLHAEVISDLWFLTLEYLEVPPRSARKSGQALLEDLHRRYLETAPEAGKIAYERGFIPALQKRHFAPKEQGIRAFAEKSGNILFDLLPLTEGLLKENRLVFIGQLRARYIGFFERLDSRLMRQEFLTNFKQLK